MPGARDRSRRQACVFRAASRGSGRPPHLPRHLDSVSVRRAAGAATVYGLSEMATRSRTGTPRPERVRDPERTRREILEIASREFAEHGFDGGRIDEIAASTSTTKRMIYYYFGSKEGLYIEVLRNAYRAIRAAEQQVDVDHSDPVAAIRQLAELTFDYHEAHPDFIRLVSIENIAFAQHMAKFESFAELNSPAIALIEKILAQGYAEGSFRRKVEAIDLHMVISALCVFR